MARLPWQSSAVGPWLCVPGFPRGCRFVGLRSVSAVASRDLKAGSDRSPNARDRGRCDRTSPRSSSRTPTTPSPSVSRGRTHHLRRAPRARSAAYAAGLPASASAPGDRVGIVAGNNWYFVAHVPRRARRRAAWPCRSTRAARPGELERELAAVGATGGRSSARPAGAPFAGVDRGQRAALEHVIATDGATSSTARCSLDDLLADGRRRRSSIATTTTSPCWCSPAARPARRRRRCSPTATCSPTSSRSRPIPDRALAADRRRARRAAAVPHLRAQRRARRRAAGRGLGRAHRALRSGLGARGDHQPRRHRRRRRARRCGRRGRSCPAPTPTRSPPCGSPRRARPGSTRRSADVFRSALRRHDHRGLRAHRGVAGRHVLRRRRRPARLGRRAAARRRGPPRRPRRRATCSIGDPGEIWVRGPERVRRLLGRRRGDGRGRSPTDGWLRTGDVAVVDDDGYLYLVDRAKDLIIVSGFNVFPAEVEEVLARAPRHRRRRRGRRAHPHSGEAVKAYVVVGDGRSPSRRTRSSPSAPSAWPATSARRR